MAELFERTAYFYLRRLREQVSREEVVSDWHMQHLMHWVLDHLLPQVEANQHSRVKSEWAMDTEDFILSEMAAFPGQMVDFASHTKDGEKVIISVYSDTNPGELYLYDRSTGQARFLMSNRQWLAPDEMASVKPFSFRARDGQLIHGYRTIPRGSSGKDLSGVDWILWPATTVYYHRSRSSVHGPHHW